MESLHYGCYSPYSKEQKEKLGNTLVYLCENVENPTKTKLLKLLYILDEMSMKKCGIPFLDLKYTVWKYGPVETDLWVDLNDPTILEDYIERVSVPLQDKKVLKAKKDFVDDEFTDLDIELLEQVTQKFRTTTAKELSKITHKPSGLWYKTAKQNGVLEFLEKEQINTTDLKLNLSDLIAGNEELQDVYTAYKEYH